MSSILGKQKTITLIVLGAAASSAFFFVQSDAPRGGSTTSRAALSADQSLKTATGNCFQRAVET